MKIKHPLPTHIIQQILTVTSSPHIDFRLWYPYLSPYHNTTTSTTIGNSTLEQLHFSTIFQLVTTLAFNHPEYTIQNSPAIQDFHQAAINQHPIFEQYTNVIRQLKHFEWCSIQCRKAIKQIHTLFNHHPAEANDLNENITTLDQHLLMSDRNETVFSFLPHALLTPLPPSFTDIPLSPIPRPILPLSQTLQKQRFASYHNPLSHHPEMHDEEWVSDMISAILDLYVQYESYLFDQMISIFPTFPWYQQDATKQSKGGPKSPKIGPTDMKIMHFIHFINRDVLTNQYIGDIHQHSHDNYITPLLSAVCSLDVFSVEALILSGALFSHEILSYANTHPTTQNNNRKTPITHEIPHYFALSPDQHNFKHYYKHSTSEFLQPFLAIEMNRTEILDIDPKEYFLSVFMVYKILIYYGTPYNIIYDIKLTHLHPLIKNIVHSQKPLVPNGHETKINTTVTFSLVMLYINSVMLYLDAWELSIANIELFPLDLWQLLVNMDETVLNICLTCDLSYSSHSHAPVTTDFTQNKGHLTVIEVLLAFPYIDITVMFDMIVLLLASLHIYTDLHIHHNVDLIKLLQSKVSSGGDDMNQDRIELVDKLFANTPHVNLVEYFDLQQQAYSKHMTAKCKEPAKNYVEYHNQVTNENSIPTDSQHSLTKYIQNNKIKEILGLYQSFMLLRTKKQSLNEISQCDIFSEEVAENLAKPPIEEDIIEINTHDLLSQDEYQKQKLLGLTTTKFTDSKISTNSPQIIKDETSTTSYKQLFKEDISANFDYNNFLQYVALHDVMVSYDTYNKVIGNVEVEGEEKKQDQDQSAHVSVRSKAQDGDDQFLVNNVIQSMFNQKLPSLTQFKMASRSALEKESEILNQVHQQHIELVQKRIADKELANSMELEKILKQTYAHLDRKEQDQQSQRDDKIDDNDDDDDDVHSIPISVMNQLESTEDFPLKFPQ